MANRKINVYMMEMGSILDEKSCEREEDTRPTEKYLQMHADTCRQFSKRPIENKKMLYTTGRQRD